MKSHLLPLLLLCLWPAVLGAAQFTLSWSDNSTNEVGFTVERAPGLAATSGFAPITNITSSTAERTSTGTRTYVDAGLADATAYTYRVCAYNSAGKSGYSNTASGTTPPPVPAAPGAPTLTAPPDYVPPVVVVSATLTMQGGQILAANVVATTPEIAAAN